jgi:hypothetical protein
MPLATFVPVPGLIVEAGSTYNRALTVDHNHAKARLNIAALHHE